MIKFLADENIPSGVTRFLRDRGFDVKEVGGEGNVGVSDDMVMALASKEERIVLTCDKHFANILTYPPRSHRGIIRIRIHPPVIDEFVRALDQLIKKFDLEAIGGCLIVLDREGYRVRRSP